MVQASRRAAKCPKPPRTSKTPRLASTTSGRICTSAWATKPRRKGFDQIASLFYRVAEIEKSHEARYLALLKNVKDGLVFSRDGDRMWQCGNCGHLIVGKTAPELCPVCKHPKAFYRIRCENY